ncbi:hypothetical protein CMUS01_08786 [Colletotrichum musicola]|uniref:AAA domain-containing protein n=1 Tax=Colletotrichum musicola TaxID=2175873 RepID=A0A8H6NC66_9PEZI|nr:hypothetical protein CMUS01_08786 [Colletotrichum musicola]
MQESRPLPIIHINGFPGTGKLTIARILLGLFRDGAAKLVHNHLLINPADAVLDRDQPGYQKLRRQIRSAVFESLVDEESTYSSAYIFTDCQTGNELGVAVCEEYRECASRRGCDFVPITLCCDEETNLARLAGDGRSAQGKLIDTALLRRFRREGELYTFDDHPTGLRLDVSRMSAEEAARAIFDYLVEIAPRLKGQVKDSVNT